MGEPVPAVLDYYGCDEQSPDGTCVGLITPQVSCVRAPEDCDKRSLDGRGTPWAEDSFIFSCFTLCMDVWFMLGAGGLQPPSPICVHGNTSPPNPNPNPNPNVPVMM